MEFCTDSHDPQMINNKNKDNNNNNNNPWAFLLKMSFPPQMNRYRINLWLDRDHFLEWVLIQLFLSTPEYACYYIQICPNKSKLQQGSNSSKLNNACLKTAFVDSHYCTLVRSYIWGKKCFLISKTVWYEDLAVIIVNWYPVIVFFLFIIECYTSPF